MKKIFKFTLIPVLFIIASLIILVIWLTITDFQPDLLEDAEILNKNDRKATSTLTIINWNLGYGGLGENMDFFLDGGTRVRAPKDEYISYRTGIFNQIKAMNAQIFFFQELDRKSRRSYKEDQFKLIADLLPGFNSSFATNYKVKYIPSPKLFGTQYGSVHSGIGIFSKFKIEKSERISLPGNYKWPKKVLFLDRCMLVSRIQTEDNSTVVLINTHNSAYDKGGFLKKEQLNLIKEYGEKEYDNGNYVIIGGDWNNYMPGTDGNSFPSEEKAPVYYQPLPADWNMENWIWGSDKTVPTNRSLEKSYEEGRTFTSIIDGYLLSPNIRIKKIKTYDLGFKHTDHNPTEITLELN